MGKHSGKRDAGETPGSYARATESNSEAVQREAANPIDQSPERISADVRIIDNSNYPDSHR